MKPKALSQLEFDAFLAKHEEYHTVMLLANKVRTWAEKYAAKNDFSDDLTGMCAIASAKLSRALTDAGIAHEIHLFNDWGCHVFLVVDDHVLDVTATQFFEFKNIKIVFRPLRMIDIEKCYYYKSSKKFSSAKELRAHQIKTSWPIHQRALPR